MGWTKVRSCTDVCSLCLPCIVRAKKLLAGWFLCGVRAQVKRLG